MFENQLLIDFLELNVVLKNKHILTVKSLFQEYQSYSYKNYQNPIGYREFRKITQVKLKDQIPQASFYKQNCRYFVSNVLSIYGILLDDCHIKNFIISVLTAAAGVWFYFYPIDDIKIKYNRLYRRNFPAALFMQKEILEGHSLTQSELKYFKQSLTKPKIQVALCVNYLDLQLRTQFIPRNIKKFACKTSQKVQNDPYSFTFKQLINLSLDFFGDILASFEYL